MLEIIDAESTAHIGVTYDTDESKAVAFALGLYAGQLEAGNIISPEAALELPVDDVVHLARELSGEISSGLSTVNPDQHKAIMGIFLPFTARIHEGMPTHLYAGFCKFLEVRPFDLFYSAMVARRMLDGKDVELLIAPGQQE